MKKQKISALFNQFGMPATLMVFGLLMLLFPDSASAIIAYGVGGVLLLAGLAGGIGALVDRQLSKLFWPLLCLTLGCTLLGQPLLLARNVGRFMGVLLAIEGGSCLRKGSQVFGIVLLVAAAALVLAPMTLSRLVFSLCGAVVLVIGIAMLLSRLKERKYLDGGDKNIIDAL